MYDLYVWVVLAGEDVGGFAVGYGVENDAEIVVVGVEGGRRNEKTHALGVHAKLLALHLNDQLAAIVGGTVNNADLLVREQLYAVAASELQAASRRIS